MKDKVAKKPFLSKLPSIERVVETQDSFGDYSYSFDNMLLISQIQRSGGSLLLQLLDGHPSVLCHPGELHIGRPNKLFWPSLDLAKTPPEIFETLWEKTMLVAAKNGYEKSGAVKNEVVPFFYLPILHVKLFTRELDALEDHERLSQQHIIRIFFKSFFASWMNEANRFQKKAQYKWMAGHVARLVNFPAETEKFFGDFGEGKFISIIREPGSWYASAKFYQPKVYGDIDSAIHLWKTSTTEALALKVRRPQQVKLISFEDLLLDTSTTLKTVTDFLEVEPLHRILPTFNSAPITSNSSFTPTVEKVDRSPIDRQQYLDPADLLRIRGMTEEVYELALAELGN